MANSILVTFSTIYSSTQEVADRIAATLREQGLEVDLQPIQQVRSIDRYQAIVLGAPLYMVTMAQGRLQLSLKSSHCARVKISGDFCARSA